MLWTPGSPVHTFQDPSTSGRADFMPVQLCCTGKSVKAETCNSSGVTKDNNAPAASSPLPNTIRRAIVAVRCRSVEFFRRLA